MNIAIHKEKKEDCYSTFFNRILGDSGGVYTKMTIEKEDYISMALTGKIKQFPIRPILWKILLRLIPIGKPFFEWLSAQEQLRIDYKNKKAKKIPGIKDISSDPLNNKSEEWRVYYEEKDIMKLIKLDIDRGEELNDNAKKMLADILLIWAREHKAVSYRQGMNDIIGIIYQAISPYYFENNESLSKEDLFIIYNNTHLRLTKSYVLYEYFNDERELEADLYHLFNAIMQKGIMALFDSANELKGKECKNEETALKKRINSIIRKLKTVDNDLYYHFDKIQIAPGTFLQ